MLPGEIEEANFMYEKKTYLSKGDVAWVWETPEQKVRRERVAAEIIDQDEEVAARAATRTQQGSTGTKKKTGR